MYSFSPHSKFFFFIKYIYIFCHILISPPQADTTENVQRKQARKEGEADEEEDSSGSEAEVLCR